MDIILKNSQGQDVTYNGVNNIKVRKTDGTQATFVAQEQGFAYLSEDYVKNLALAGVDLPTISTLRFTKDTQYKVGTKIEVNIGDYIEVYVNGTDLNIYSDKTIEMFNTIYGESETGAVIKALLAYCRIDYVTEEMEFYAFNDYEASTSLLYDIYLDNFDTSEVTSMKGLTVIPDAGGGNVRNIYGLDKLDTSNVTDMGGMFSACGKVTSLDLSNFNTSNVTDMSSMFAYCEKLTDLDLSSFDTSNVTDMSWMFDCPSLTKLSVETFTTQNVMNMSGMFAGCHNITDLDLSSFDTSSATSMDYMFQGCSGLTELNLSNFDTSSVIHMDGMFNGCVNLNSIDLSSFDVSNSPNMNRMFGDDEQISQLQYIYVSQANSDWTAYGTDDNEMFINCTALPNYDENKTGISQAKLSTNDGYFTLKE